MDGIADTISGHELLQGLCSLKQSGTAVFSAAQTAVIFTLRDGTPSFRYTFGDTSKSVGDVSVRFYAHEEPDIPQLKSYFPNSQSLALRSLPNLGNDHSLPPELDLMTLLASFGKHHFSGFISGQANEQALILLIKGQIVLAILEQDNQIMTGQDALRLIRRLSMKNLQLAWGQLDTPILQALLGLSQTPEVPEADVETFTGIRTEGKLFQFFEQGRLLFQVACQKTVPSAYYPLTQGSQNLIPPEEPLGWEQDNYHLTLRGKDALNPMTDLSMQFEHSYGREGRHVLKNLKDAGQPEQLSRKLRLSLSELKPWLEKLEHDGFIRKHT